MVKENAGNPDRDKGNAGNQRRPMGLTALIERNLREHGLHPRTKDEPDMPRFATCGEHGTYPRFDKDAHGVIRWHADGCPTCRTQQRVERLMARAAIPKRHALSTFENYVVEREGQAHALRIARSYAEQFSNHLETGTSLLFLGASGTGKNHLAAAIGRAILTQGFSVLHTTAFEVTAKIKATWGKEDYEPRRQQLDVINDFASVDLLILDEVGRSVSASVDSTLLFHVIDQRYLKCHPTLVISNYDLNVVEQWLTPAGLDRLREGGGDCVQFYGDSERGRHAV